MWRVTKRDTGLPFVLCCVFVLSFLLSRRFGLSVLLTAKRSFNDELATTPFSGISLRHEHHCETALATSVKHYTKIRSRGVFPIQQFGFRRLRTIGDTPAQAYSERGPYREQIRIDVAIRAHIRTKHTHTAILADHPRVG